MKIIKSYKVIVLKVVNALCQGLLGLFYLLVWKYNLKVKSSNNKGAKPVRSMTNLSIWKVMLLSFEEILNGYALIVLRNILF